MAKYAERQDETSVFHSMEELKSKRTDKEDGIYRKIMTNVRFFPRENKLKLKLGRPQGNIVQQPCFISKMFPSIIYVGR